MPKRRGNIRGVDDTREDDQEGVGDDVGETEGDEAPAPTEGAGSMPSFDPDDLGENGGGDADENAHLDSDLDEDEAPVVPDSLSSLAA